MLGCWWQTGGPCRTKYRQRGRMAWGLPESFAIYSQRDASLKSWLTWGTVICSRFSSKGQSLETKGMVGQGWRMRGFGVLKLQLVILWVPVASHLPLKMFPPVKIDQPLNFFPLPGLRCACWAFLSSHALGNVVGFSTVPNQNSGYISWL